MPLSRIWPILEPFGLTLIAAAIIRLNSTEIAASTASF
jgi:hypothetical protein